MKYLRVKNWDKFQHDSTKPLPWIKFFTALLAPTKEPWYSELPDAQKALLHHIWLMARVFNGKIPETWLTKEKLNLQSKVNLDKLIESGSIWFEDETGHTLDTSCARDARSGLSGSQTLGSDRGVPGGRDADSQRLLDGLAGRGLKVPPRKEAAILKWPGKYGTDAVLAACDANLEAIEVADRPLQYLAAILRNGGSRGKRNGAGGGRTEQRKPTASDFGMRTLADV